MKYLILFCCLFIGCESSQHEPNYHQPIPADRTLVDNSHTIYTIDHDGHRFITTRNFILHHPDCECGHAFKLEQDEK